MTAKTAATRCTLQHRPYAETITIGTVLQPSNCVTDSVRKMASAGRLVKELKEVGKDDSSGVRAAPLLESNMNHLRATVQGPEGTPYEGGVFEIDIHIPKQYPFEPPKMKFITKVWHPNISSQTGAICLVGTTTRTGRCFF